MGMAFIHSSRRKEEYAVMDMRLVKESIQLEQPTGRGQSQAVV